MPNPDRRHDRAELAFHIYAELTPPRSLPRLAMALGDLGLPIPLGTLRRYSRQYGWQGRLRERAQERDRERRRRALDQFADTLDRQQEVARGLVRFGLGQLREITSDPTRRSRIGAHATLRALDIGMRLDRQASGEKHDLTQLMTGLAERFLPEVADLIRTIVVPIDHRAASDLADGIQSALHATYEALLNPEMEERA